MRRKISLLLVLSAVLFLSSCLDSGDQSYLGRDEYSYITETETGIVYARTTGGNYITSSKISLLTPGTTAFLTYQITEETEVITVDENMIIHKVALGADPIEIDQEQLQQIAAPETDTVYFESLIAPPTWITHQSLYYGDRWPFEYRYNAKKGEYVRVSFYKVLEDNHPENLNADVLIDVRIEKFGTPEAGAKEELKGDLIVANMSMLRPMPSVDSQETKQLNIKFRFFRADRKGDLHISDSPITITVRK